MISVVIPTYNEEKNIQLIAKSLVNIKVISEIIFVDDNSIDNTTKEIRKINSNRIVLIERKKNKDLSKSVYLGVSRSKNNFTLIMDCDLQHDCRYILKMWKKI